MQAGVPDRGFGFVQQGLLFQEAVEARPAVIEGDVPLPCAADDLAKVLIVTLPVLVARRRGSGGRSGKRARMWSNSSSECLAARRLKNSAAVSMAADL